MRQWPNAPADYIIQNMGKYYSDWLIHRTRNPRRTVAIMHEYLEKHPKFRIMPRRFQQVSDELYRLVFISLFTLGLEY